MTEVYCPICWKELVVNTSDKKIENEDVIVFCADDHETHKMWNEERARKIREKNNYSGNDG